MNADGRSLFDAICADPEDDVSRLAYADWLDEDGDEARAEALRMSVERRRLPVWEPRAWVLDSRLGRLHKKHRRAWNSAVPKRRGVVAEVGASGLVEEIRVLSIRAFLAHEGDIFSTGPISSLDLAMDRGSAGELLACPSLARVRELRFSMARTEQMDLPRLAESPTFENLRVLDLDESGPDLADYLTTCPPFPRLESLKFVRQSFGGEWPRGAPLLRTVRKLVLWSCYLQNGWLRQLLRLPSIQSLRHLDLYECWATGFGDFFGVDWQGLECLLVNANSFGATAARGLARCPRMTSLRWLDLGAEYDRLGDKGLKALAGSDYLGGLRVLDLSINQITAAGLDAMSRAPWARTLARLDLSANSLRKERAAALAPGV